MKARFFAPLALGLALAFGAPAAEAQQVNPTDAAVQEEQLLKALQGDAQLTGRVSIPDDKAAALVKPANKEWAAEHNGAGKTLPKYAILGMLLVLAVFFMARGKIRIDGGPAGTRILRFGGIERFAHWLMAGSFIVLALTGLNLAFGARIVAPIIGAEAFGSLTAFGKTTHNYIAWAFMAGLALSFLLWVVHNIPSGADLQWLAQGGGLLKNGAHPPARKFNAGQKGIFWAVMIGGAILSYTGFMMLFPAGAPAADWQHWQFMHGMVSGILTAIILAHIYIGSIGMEGAFDAMGKGDVDLNWARQHHSLWVDEARKPSTPAE